MMERFLERIEFMTTQIYSNKRDLDEGGWSKSYRDALNAEIANLAIELADLASLLVTQLRMDS